MDGSGWEREIEDRVGAVPTQEAQQMPPIVDAVCSVIRKYMMGERDVQSIESVAASLVNDSGIAPVFIDKVVVIIGDDAAGEDEEVVCRGAKDAVRIVVNELRGADVSGA